MTEKCQECGKELKDASHAPYCKECDEKLDKQFDLIEDNIIIYKELRDNEVEILNKFEKEDIVDLFKRVYKKFKEEGGLKEDSIIILNKIKDTFKLKDSELGTGELPQIKESKKDRLLKSNQCPGCEKKIQKDFNLCPYCGYKLKEDSVSSYKKEK